VWQSGLCNGHCVTLLLYHCVTVCAQASCPSGTQCVWQSGFCNGHCVTVSLCVRRPCAPAALSACASLVSAMGTVSLCYCITVSLCVRRHHAQRHSVRVAVWFLQRALCHCVTVCAQALCPSSTQCVCQSGLCKGHCVTVSLYNCVTVCAQASCPAALSACSSLVSATGTVSLCHCVCAGLVPHRHSVRVAVWSLQWALYHCVTTSLYHCVNVSLCHYVCAGVVPQRQSVSVAVWSLQWALCHCVTVSLCHCVCAGLVPQRHSVRVPVWSLQWALCHCVTMSLYHCVTVSLCHYVCAGVSAPAAISECGSLVSAMGTVSLCHCITVSLCVLRLRAQRHSCVWQSGLCNGHCVTVSLSQ